MKKVIIPLLLIPVLLTGCQSEEPKNKSVTIENKDKNNKNSSSNNTDSNNNINNTVSDTNSSKTIKEINYAEAKNTVNRHISSALGGRLKSTAMFFYLNENGNIDKYKFNTIGSLTMTKLSNIVDNYNELDTKTYNEEDVLRILTNELKGYNSSYYEVDKEYSKDGESVIKEFFANKMGVVYFKKDKVYVAGVGGLGGVTLTTISEESNWKIEGDRLIIPLLNPDGVAGEIVLKENNKVYTGGEKRSYYYVDSFNY